MKKFSPLDFIHYNLEPYNSAVTMTEFLNSGGHTKISTIRANNLLILLLLYQLTKQSIKHETSTNP